MQVLWSSLVIIPLLLFGIWAIRQKRKEER